MLDSKQFATIRLLKDYQPGQAASAGLADLRAQLDQVPDLRAVKLAPKGASTVLATLPASNQRQKSRLTTLISQSIQGWKVVMDSTYRLPTSF